MKTLILFLDAISPDKITKESTPFLYALSQKYNLGTHYPVFGFSSIPASFMTGRYPETHGQFTLYWHDPPRGIKDPLLDFLPSNIASYYFNLRRFLKGEDFLAPLAKSDRAFFSLAQKRFHHHKNALPVPTLFNILDEKGLRFLVYHWPLLATEEKSRMTPFVRNSDESRVNKFLSFTRNKEFDLYFLHLWDVDKTGHRFGPQAEETKGVLRQQDRLAEKIVERFSLQEDLILIWSDHGMVEVKGFVNLKERLPKNGDGVFYFLDSTMARFWFKDGAVRKRVLETLSNVKEGHLLTADEKKKFKIDFDHQKYGEGIFLLDPGFVFRPNFFHKEGAVKGMHGYDLSDEAERGFFILNRDCQPFAETVDFLPIILKVIRDE